MSLLANSLKNGTQEKLSIFSLLLVEVIICPKARGISYTLNLKHSHLYKHLPAQKHNNSKGKATLVDWQSL
jgi:hypothetical protein